MADVFVSYARSDMAIVAPLVAAIEARGWSVWWDPEIDTGQQFDDQIERKLKAAKADPDLDPLREDPRFKSMIAAAEARIAAAGDDGS